MSIQSKLTLWFTASMILLAFLMFGFLALASSSVTVRNSRSVLQRVFHEIAGKSATMRESWIWTMISKPMRITSIPFWRQRTEESSPAICRRNG